MQRYVCLPCSFLKWEVFICGLYVKAALSVLNETGHTQHQASVGNKNFL